MTAVSGRAPTGQALVASDQAASRLDPLGIDPSRGSESPDFYEYLRRFTAMGRAVHAAAERLREESPEVKLRNTIETALSVIKDQADDARWSTHWRCGLGQAHKIMSNHLEIASGIAARSDETLQAAQPEGQEPDPKGTPTP